MPVKVLIPTPLRLFAERKDSIQLDARSVGEALDLLTGRYSELRKHLYADDGRLRSFVNVFLNDEDIRFLQKETTPIKDGDIISIIPSIAGGSGNLAGAASVALAHLRCSALDARHLQSSWSYNDV
jgi:adenylyltransferase/sulfurtransferase